MVLVVGQNSTWQNSYVFPELSVGNVNRVARVYAFASGKGANVVRALKGLGSDACLLAYAGGPNGDRFTDACEIEGLTASFVRIEAETRMCTTLIEDSGQVTELVEPAPPVTAVECEAFREMFGRKLAGAGFLVIAGTAMTGEPVESFREIVLEARAHGVPCLLDSYRAHGKRALAASPEILKINSSELSELTGLPVGSLRERRDAGREIIERWGIRWVIITMGASGVEGFDATSAVRVSVPQVKLVNPIGSGDSCTAGVVSHVLQSNGGWDDLAEAVKLGAAMGTANCMSMKPASLDPAHLSWVLDHVAVDEPDIDGEPG